MTPAEHEKLEAELEAQERDAARYRWLLSHYDVHSLIGAGDFTSVDSFLDGERQPPATTQQQAQKGSRMRRVMERYGCDSESAYRYLDLRDEGHGPYQAAVMADIADPDVGGER